MIQEPTQARPSGWRIGQTIFNFLWWLHDKKGYKTELTGWNGNINTYAEGRMADPFHISDEEWHELYVEFLKEHATPT